MDFPLKLKERGTAGVRLINILTKNAVILRVVRLINNLFP